MCMHIYLGAFSKYMLIKTTSFPVLSPHSFLYSYLNLRPQSSSPFDTLLCLQEDARADVVDCIVRDIQNTQCLLNVEYSGATCPHVTLQFGDTKEDVGLGLVKEGLVMVEVRKEKHLQKMVSEKMRYLYGGGMALIVS